MQTIKAKQDKRFQPVARVRQGNKIGGLMLFEYATRNLVIYPLGSIAPSKLAEWGIDDINKLPLFGHLDCRMILLAKEGTDYWVYVDSEVKRMSLDEIIALNRRTYCPLNFCIVHTPDKNTYLKPKRGTLYTYNIKPADNDTYVVLREFIVDSVKDSEMLFFHNKDNAYACLNKIIKEMKALAKQYGWTDEAGDYDCPTNPPIGYSVWKKWCPRTDCLSVTLDKAIYED